MPSRSRPSSHVRVTRIRAGTRTETTGRADPHGVVPGAAGLSLAHRLAGPGSGRRAPSVALLDAPPGPLRPPRRTWCFWEAGPGRFDAAVTASWRSLRVRDRGGRLIDGDIAPLRYKMIRSDDFEHLVARDLAGHDGVRRVEGTVDTVEDVPGGALVRLRDRDGAPRVVGARWVFDSRPPGSLPAARTTLLQHFHGWFVRTARPAFAPHTAELMDFRTPQPADGLSAARAAGDEALPERRPQPPLPRGRQTPGPRGTPRAHRAPHPLAGRALRVLTPREPGRAPRLRAPAGHPPVTRIKGRLTLPRDSR